VNVDGNPFPIVRGEMELKWMTMFDPRSSVDIFRLYTVQTLFKNTIPAVYLYLATKVK
jgi:hypothetical protein